MEIRRAGMGAWVSVIKGPGECSVGLTVSGVGEFRPISPAVRAC